MPRARLPLFSVSCWRGHISGARGSGQRPTGTTRHSCGHRRAGWGPQRSMSLVSPSSVKCVKDKSRACGDQRLWALVLPRGEGIQARLPLDQGATQGGPPPRWGAGSSKAGGGPGSEPASAGILGRAHSTNFTPALLLPHHSSFTVSLSTHPGKVYCFFFW